MASRLSIFHPAGRLGLKANPFGKDVANRQLFQALARHGGFERIDVLSQAAVTDAELQADMLEGAGEPAGAATAVHAASVLNQQVAAEAGALLRGQPDLYDLAWMRRRVAGDAGYSLLGLVHTLAPPAVRQNIAMSLRGPTHPWDAIICTSPSVQDALRQMLADVGDEMAERTGGRAPEGPQLPVVPLGVDAAAFAAQADRPQARRAVRARLGVGEYEILVLWVGRLSFFEKAFPQPMFAAAQAGAAAAGVRAHFAMAGWFPGEGDRAMYLEAAAAEAPDVALHLLDGNDQGLLGELWAGADIFLSLVDNVQETFGITPVEAMASGLPVVVSDWDGYRYTVRDGAEGFLVPTLLSPGGGLGRALAARHILSIDSYQAYVGALAQHTAVNIPRAAEALARLMADPGLRRRMGAAGQARARATFDWPVVARLYADLVDDLGRVRAEATAPEPRHRLPPEKGDPYRDFAGFPTHRLALDTRLAARPDATAAALRATQARRLDRAFASSRANIDECVQALDFLQARGGATVNDVLLLFPPPRRRLVETGLVWMAKLGFVDWLT